VRCWPSGIPEKNNIPDGLKVVHTPDLVIFLYESRTIYRQIFTDGRPSCESDTFVVGTALQNGKTWLDMRGLPANDSGCRSAGSGRRDTRHRAIHASEDRADGP
jgi:hypothetical protein